jgi:hypothetical protein
LVTNNEGKKILHFQKKEEEKHQIARLCIELSATSGPGTSWACIPAMAHSVSQTGKRLNPGAQDTNETPSKKSKGENFSRINVLDDKRSFISMIVE